MTSPQFRGALRAAMAAVGLAAGATINFIWPGLPDQILALWGAVFMALFGVAEAYYDARHSNG